MNEQRMLLGGRRDDGTLLRNLTLDFSRCSFLTAGVGGPFCY